MVPGYRIYAPPQLDARQMEGAGRVLIDCVEGGASVSFMLPMTRQKAQAFWRR